ncbi:MAG: hypothetical protein E6K19_00855, partial [Methanobacteriota archaeon]
MVSRVGAWAEMVALFLLLYAGVPWAGLQIDRVLAIPPWPSPLPWFGLGGCLLGFAGLGWCFVL